MEFTVSKADLARELGLLQGVVEKKTTIPILSNVLLEARGDRLYLTATDLGVHAAKAALAPGAAGTIGSKRIAASTVHAATGCIRFWVRVPVLSVQITSVDPSVSTALRRFTSAPLRASRLTAPRRTRSKWCPPTWKPAMPRTLWTW